MTGIDRRGAILALGAAAVGAASLVETGAGAVAAPAYDDPDEMYAALRSQPGDRIMVRGGSINLVLADGVPGLDRARVVAWVRNAAAAISAYFGRFPVADYGLLVIAEPGDRVGHATTFGYRGSATRIHVGVDADAAAFRRDWVLVHEMVHTALPDLPRRALWLQEGNATYVEPIARATAGQLPAAEVWREAASGMAKGRPGASDGGMDGTRAWGRLYWGGATFWLLAEVAIHEESGGRHTLRDALRAINRTSGGNIANWQPEQVMAVGDAATGTHALADLYRRFANQRVDADLLALFARLGIMVGADGIVGFNDRAPLAPLRRRITRSGV